MLISNFCSFLDLTFLLPQIEFVKFFVPRDMAMVAEVHLKIKLSGPLDFKHHLLEIYLLLANGAQQIPFSSVSPQSKTNCQYIEESYFSRCVQLTHVGCEILSLHAFLTSPTELITSLFHSIIVRSTRLSQISRKI